MSENIQHNLPTKSPEQQSLAERYFEKVLWNSRYIVMVAVIASLIMALGVFYLTAVDVFHTLSHLTHYHSEDDAGRAALKAQTVAHIVGAVDGFLLGTIMLIFSLGLYELFISKLEEAEGNNSSKILQIGSLDDLKDKLAKVILMILIVMFFEQAVFLKPNGPLELLYYALAIMMVALALYLSHKAYEK